MHLRAHARRLACWLAALTLLLSGIAPGIAQTVVAASDNVVIEVCTAHGSKWVHVDGSPAQAPTKDGLLAHGECLSCCLQAPMAPPPHLPALEVHPLAGCGAPLPGATPPPPWQGWVAALPRAPPARA